MRVLILAVCGALALAACGNNDQADNTTNVDENLTAENIVSNDITAIDAVTGDAANMAADMDVNYTNDLDNGLDNLGEEPDREVKPVKRTKPAANTPATSESAGNTAANTATNATD